MALGLTGSLAGRQQFPVRGPAPLAGVGVLGKEGGAEIVGGTAVAQVFLLGGHEGQADAGQTGQVLQDMLDAFGVVMDPHGSPPLLFDLLYTIWENNAITCAKFPLIFGKQIAIM